MQFTPIFDQLVEEFEEKDIHILGLYEKTEPTISMEEVKDGISYLSNLEQIFGKDEKDGIGFLTNLGETLAQDEEESTDVMEAVTEEWMDSNIQTADEMREGAGVTHKTLYDATKLAVIKPAIPEMVKLPHQPIDDLKGPQSVADVLKEADEELGLDNFDEAFEVAAKALEQRPTSVITVQAKATPATVAALKKEVRERGYDIKVEQALPRRQNKRNKNRDRNRAGSTT